MRIVGIIPARYGSTRLHAKPLVQIKGKPLIERVYKQACRSKLLNDVVIATDDFRIAAAARKFKGKTVLTSKGCKSGTDRLAEVARKVEKNADILVNIQGDEPLLSPLTIDAVVFALKKNRSIEMATAAFHLRDKEELNNPNVVKVVLDTYSNAVYFSRYPVPFEGQEGKFKFLKHMGIYGYRRGFLLKFASWEQTPLEKAEQLEQLRALEKGYKIKVVITKKDSIGVDTREDIRKVENMLR
jgi:3-deoxy-manno-octulosonate cytidylyltransferase (CMP-KDO synthetase)